MDHSLRVVFRDLDRHGVGAEQAVGAAGRAADCVELSALSAFQRHWIAAVRAVDFVCQRGLGDVARSALGIDHLRHDFHGGRRTVGAGVLHHHADGADGLQPVPRNHQADTVSGSGQTDAGVRDAVRLLLVLAVADHLGGQPAGRNQLLPEPHPWRMGHRGAGDYPVPLCAALRAAAVEGTQEGWPPVDLAGCAADVHAAGGHLLVRGAEFRARARTFLLQHLVPGCADWDRRTVAGVLLVQPAAASVAADLRAASTKFVEPGVGTWPLITTTSICCGIRQSITTAPISVRGGSWCFSWDCWWPASLSSW